MFPSSGLFSNLNCPFSKRGHCERPQCWFKHGAQPRDAAGGAAAVGCAGLQNGFPYAGCGAPVNDATRVVCFQQIERINKEIESVRNEVEREQRRLSCYQTVQAESKTTGPNVAEDAETFSQARKYVVDNSKPRTDLEYDPLSNFSADLRSYSSVGKEQKLNNVQGLKRARQPAPCDQTKPVSYQPQLSQSPLPDPFDSNEEDILIIDIPPSTDKKIQKSLYSVGGKSFQDKVEELKVKKTPILFDSLLLSLANTEAARPLVKREDNTVDKNCCTKNSQGPSNRHENKESQNIQFDGSVIDLTKYSGGRKRQKTVVEKSPEAASPLQTTDKQDKNCNGPVGDKKETTFHVESPQRELPDCGEKMNPDDPYRFPSKNSLFYKPPETPDSAYKQLIKQVLTADLPAPWSSTKSVPSVLPYSQKTSQKMPGLMLGKATDDCTSPKSTLNPALGSRHGQAERNLSPSKLAQRAETSSASTEKHMEKTGNGAAIIIDSGSDDEDELNYSEIELSDSDPMEECYRIFMEANNEEKSTASVGAMDEKKTESNVKPQAVTGNKRVAHEAKHTEPGAKSRPEPKVLVPLRGPAVSGFASHPTIPTKTQQVQQRASMLPASAQSVQAFVSSTCQRRPETQSAPRAPAQIIEKTQPVSVTNAYLKYISLGTAVIEVGNNMQLILPQGAISLPVASTCSQVTTVLTPISQVRPNTAADRQTHHPAAVTLQRHHTTTPVLIPAQARKPSMASASTYLNPATSAAPQPAGNTTVKPGSTKRKLKQGSEGAKDKVPHDVRQRYVNMFTEVFLKTTANVNDAFEKALAEEKTVYNRSVNKLKYLSVAVNALKRLRNQSAVAVKADKNVVSSQKFKGNIQLNEMNIKGNDDTALYESLTDYILTEEMLIEGNYPVKHPEKQGCAVLFEDNKKGPADTLKRICCRCGATYSVDKTGKHIRKDECNYHYGKVVRNRVPGGIETRYSCCEGVMGAPGCQVYKLHVHDSLSMDGFVSTPHRYPTDTRCPGVYSIDCEMCYTINGLELSRVTLVNSSLQVIYDTFVRPDHEVIDYNTRFSGISEDDVRGNRTSLKEVQESLLSFISADTILIGHGLDTDLCALKLLHGTVVDTSVVFPHRLGPPHKRTLNNLTAEYLTRIIQESVCGHDTAEDASACMELILWKVKEDGKVKK